MDNQNLPEYTLEDLHSEMLVLLKKFHQICADIPYSLHGGTLLGAIREGGFIPWDDDVDITLTRAEYKKLEKLLSQMPCDEDIDFLGTEWDRIPIVVLKRNGKPLVWLDIFIYDYISENPVSQKLKLFFQYLLAAITKEKQDMEITKEKESLHKIKYLLYWLVFQTGRIFPMEKKIALRDWFAENAFCGKRQYIHRSNDQYIGRRLILPVGTMDNYELIPFVDTELMITSAYKEVLASTYGEDYMIPKRFDVHQDMSHEIRRKRLIQKLAKKRSDQK